MAINSSGGIGFWVALQVRKCFDYLELNDGHNRVPCSWVRIRGKTNTADILVRVQDRPPARIKKKIKYSVSS